MSSKIVFAAAKSCSRPIFVTGLLLGLLLIAGTSAASTLDKRRPAEQADSLFADLRPLPIPAARTMPAAEEARTVPASSIDPTYVRPELAISDTGVEMGTEVSDDGVSIALDNDARAFFGPRYGGSWVEGAGSSKHLVIGVVRLNSSDELWLKTKSANAQLRETAYALSQLDDWADRATTLAQRLRVVAMIGSNPTRSAVEIQLAQISESFKSALERAIPYNILDIRLDKSFNLQLSHATRQDWLAYILHFEGGLEINTSHSRCTTGFYIWQSTYGAQGTTAGHCGTGGEQVWSPAGGFLDSVRYNVYEQSASPNADVLVFSTSGIANYPRVMATNTDHPTVMGAFAQDYPRLNEAGMCRIGMVSNNELCGGVVNKARVRVTDTNGRAVWSHCINLANQPGDSGGPIYRRYSNGTVRAAGTMNASLTIDGVVSTCYSQIYWILKTTSTGLVIG